MESNTENQDKDLQPNKENLQQIVQNTQTNLPNTIKHEQLSPKTSQSPQNKYKNQSEQINQKQPQEEEEVKEEQKEEEQKQNQQNQYQNQKKNINTNTNTNIKKINEKNQQEQSPFKKKPQIKVESIKKTLEKNELITEINNRKFINELRWICNMKPQYLYNCAMNTVAQSWNYLFSNLGHGQQMPICQEEALFAFGFGKKPFYSQGFSPGNGQLIMWFEALCKYRKVQGKAGFFWKKVGYNKTKITDNQALEKIKSALKSNNISLVYHCNNHYMLPIGYEESPKNPKLTYKVKTQDLKPEEKNTYIIVADQALLPNSQVFVVPNFENICTDLGTEHPYLYNIKGENLTLKRGDEFYPGGKQYKDNRHCLLAFYKI